MAVSVAWVMQANVTETLEANVPGAPNPDVIHTSFSSDGTFNASSTVPATETVVNEFSLTAGALTLDLTSIQGTEGTVDGTGLKLQILKLINKAGNATMAFTVGATNGYDVAGSDWKVTLAAGQEEMLQLNDAAPDISGTEKTIDVTGTGTETFQIVAVMG